jgi:type IV pilus assembly protein PilE
MPTQTIAARFSRRQAGARRVLGFSLLELMIVIAVVGLLSAVAWPSYQRSVGRGQRNAAQGYATDVAQREEQYFLDNHQYAPTLAALNFTVVPAEVSAYYGPAVITIPNPAPGSLPNSYLIGITPIAGTYNATHPNAAPNNDGVIFVNSIGQQYRSVQGLPVGNGVFGFNGASDCNFSDSTCVPH